MPVEPLIFAAAAAIAGKVEIHGVGEDSLQGDVKFFDVLSKMGAKVKKQEHSVIIERADYVELKLI